MKEDGTAATPREAGKITAEDIERAGFVGVVLLRAAAGLAFAAIVDSKDAESRRCQHGCLLLPAFLREPAAVSEHDGSGAGAVEVGEEEASVGRWERHLLRGMGEGGDGEESEQGAH